MIQLTLPLESLYSANSPLAARLSAKSDLPILVLENLEHNIESIHCSASMMRISFTSPDLIETLKDEFAQVTDLILVTAHDGCNDVGERKPYLYAPVFPSATSCTVFFDNSLPWKLHPNSKRNQY
jgi:hypothetical protein